MIWAPATLVIRGLMGFIVGKIARLENPEPNRLGLIAMIVGHIEKNVGCFLHDYYLFGSVSFLGLLTLFPKSIAEIGITIGLLVAVRRTPRQDLLGLR